MLDAAQPQQELDSSAERHFEERPSSCPCDVPPVEDRRAEACVAGSNVYCIVVLQHSSPTVVLSAAVAEDEAAQCAASPC